MTKSSDGYWVLSDGVEMTNTNDIPVWVTAINGEQLSDTVPQLGKPAMFVLSRGLFHFGIGSEPDDVPSLPVFLTLVYSHTIKPHWLNHPPLFEALLELVDGQRRRRGDGGRKEPCYSA